MISKEERARRFKEARTIHNVHGRQGIKAVHEGTKQIDGTGVSASMISDLETSIYKPGKGIKERPVQYQKIVLLAEYYGVNVAWLMGMSDSWSINEDSQLVTKTTGLSSEAVETLCSLGSEQIACLNALLTSHSFQNSLLMMAQAKEISEQSNQDDDAAQVIERSNMFRIKHRNDINAWYKIDEPNTISDRQLIKMYRTEALQDIGNAFREIAPANEEERKGK